MKYSSGVLVYNSTGELALQMRAKHDDTYPGRWDFSAGGGRDEGEDIEAAAERELMEEIGVRSPLTFLQQFVWPGNDEKQPDDIAVFKTVYDGDFTPDPNEVDGVRFFAVAAVRKMVEETPDLFHPEFVYYCEHYDI